VRRQILVVVLVIVGLVWGYAIWHSVRSTSPENLDDAARRAIDEACTTAREALVALPDLAPDATAADDVSLVEQENDIFSTMIRQIDATKPEGGDAAAALDAWVADWRNLVMARADFAEDLADDGSARLRIPSVSGGGLRPITDRMDEYAVQQGLDRCRPEALQAEVVDIPRDYSDLEA
jgi:hypothetical protein